MVKFARYVPDGPQTEQIYNTAKYFIEETRELPEDDKGHKRI
jgi:hypothetical protein